MKPIPYAIATALVLTLTVVRPALGQSRDRAPVSEPRSTRAEGTLPDGALWAVEVPANWNGTLLLNSHGYSIAIRPPETAPADLKGWLLAHGYALAASSYAKPGWAIAEAVPDQMALLDLFAQRFGAPHRTITWGNSMGGLISIALTESHPERFDGGLSLCGSIGGSLGMMNMAFDGAFVFKTLIAPQSEIELVGISDDRANGSKVSAAVASAQQSAQGRARLALASVMAQLPEWSDPAAPRPAPGDYDAIESQAATTFALGVFLPRTDQERRAGGPFSWNTGIDYRVQLARSGRRAYVEALYAKAGLDLGQDLDTLAAAARIAADPGAVAYMRANYVPSGRLARPIFSAHTIGDGATVPSNQSAYAATVAEAGRSGFFRESWVARAGHCTFTAAESAAALRTLEMRIDEGKWDSTPHALNQRANATGLGESAFATFVAAPFLRPCNANQRACSGEQMGPAKIAN